jgi:ATP-dependent DNA ligase
VALPLNPPIEPQLARSKPELPLGEGWAYEQKYDGFRAIAFIDGGDVVLQSRGAKPLTRYFPEIAFPAMRCVLDGEIVVDGAAGGPDAQDFGALQQRIHPAESRINRLAAEIPARYVAFDLLALDDEVLLDRPFSERRALLEGLAGVFVTPLTSLPAEAEPWLAHTEGVIAKEIGAPYRPGKRIGMVKVKRIRTIDAVVCGYRPGIEEGTVGSLILGLYGTDGRLRVVGHSSGLKAAEKKALVATLEPYETGTRGHGDPSRWKNEKELEWIELRPELVVEVKYDHSSGGRIRHGTKILRWREDKAPSECLLEQMDQ